jgi:hypothetical protein
MYPVMGQDGLICIGPSIRIISIFFRILFGYVSTAYPYRIRIQRVSELQLPYPCCTAVSLKASSVLETLKLFIGTLCSANFFFLF